MKHFLALTLIFLSLPLVACTDPQATGTLPAVTTLDEVTAALSEIEFRSEWIDHRQAASETWSRKQGDCEDYAFLAAELLNQQGIEAHVLYIYCWPEYRRKSPMANHAACLFRDTELTGGCWWFYSLDVLRKTEQLEVSAAVYHVRVKQWVKSWVLYDRQGREIESRDLSDIT